MLLVQSPGQTPGWGVWLFEKPITSAAVVAFAACIVAVVLYRRGRVRGAWGAAGVGMALTAGVFMTGRMVTTDRERIVQGTKDFVAAVAESDPIVVRELLDDRLIVTSRSMLAPNVDKDTVITITRQMRDAGIRSHFVKIDQAGVSRSGVGSIEMRVQVTGEYGPATSRWRLEWQRHTDGVWRIVEIDCLSINGVQPSGLWWTRIPGV